MNFKKMLRLGLLAIVIIILLSSCGPTDKAKVAEKPTIKIGYLPITHAIPLYVQKEILEANANEASFELELVKFSSWPDLMDALNMGRIDGASALVPVAMKANELGINLKAVALSHRDGNVLIGDTSIEDVAELEGETFAIPHKLSTHNILFYDMLKQAGVDYEDVNVVEMTPAEMPSALSRGQIAGYVVAEPIGAQSVVIGSGNVLYQSDELVPNAIDCALIFHGDFLENNEAIAQDFMISYVQAAEKAETKNEQVREVTSEYMRADDEVMDLSLEWISFDHLKINQDAYENLRASLIEMGLSENPPAYDEFVDNTFIDGVR